MMRVHKQIARVRYEAELEVIVGELNDLEDEFDKLTPKDFIAAWMPEIRDTKLTIKLRDKPYDTEKHGRDKGKGNRAKQMQLPFSPEAD